MAASIPESFTDLFNKRVFGFLTTLMPDGSPQTQPVWVDYENGKVLLTSALGRQKDKNVRRDPRVAITLMDPDNPYRYLEIRGKVTEVTHEGAAQHIDKMAKKYLGQDKYPWAQPGEQRVLYKIQPEKIRTQG
jgi:PPOX class probable F420-dependent enzyme